MNRQRAKELLPIIQAFAEGKTIQVNCAGSWMDVIQDPSFTADPKLYRIKPEPMEIWVVRNKKSGCCTVVSDPTDWNDHFEKLRFREVTE